MTGVEADVSRPAVGRASRSSPSTRHASKGSLPTEAAGSWSTTLRLHRQAHPDTVVSTTWEQSATADQLSPTLRTFTGLAALLILVALTAAGSSSDVAGHHPVTRPDPTPRESGVRRETAPGGSGRWDARRTAGVLCRGAGVVSGESPLLRCGPGTNLGVDRGDAQRRHRARPGSAPSRREDAATSRSACAPTRRRRNGPARPDSRLASPGLVTDVRSLWISNSVALTASPDVVRASPRARTSRRSAPTPSS